MDHRGAQPGPVAPIAVIDVLDHLFAPLMFEIHVDIGRLVPRLADEALEDHRADLGRYRGDAKGIADHRIRRRSPPLAQDAARPRKKHDVMHGQEIGLVAQLADQGQLVGHLGADLVRGTRRIAPVQPRPGQPRQPLRCRFPIGGFRRVDIAQRVQREAQPRGNVPAAVHRRLMPGKEAQHFGFRPQAGFGIGQRAATQRIDPAAQADGRQHISQPPPRAVMHHRQRRGDGGNAQPVCQPRQPVKPRPVLPVIARGHQQRDLAGKALRQPQRQGCPVVRTLWRYVPGGGMQQHLLPLAPVKKVFGEQLAIALARPPAPVGQQPAEPPPGRTVARQQRDGQPVARHDPRCGDQARGRPVAPGNLARLDMGAHDARHTVFIGNRQRGQAQIRRTPHHLLGVRGPGEEGEVGGDGKLGKRHGWTLNETGTSLHDSPSSASAAWPGRSRGGLSAPRLPLRLRCGQPLPPEGIFSKKKPRLDGQRSFCRISRLA